MRNIILAAAVTFALAGCASAGSSSSTSPASQPASPVSAETSTAAPVAPAGKDPAVAPQADPDTLFLAAVHGKGGLPDDKLVQLGRQMCADLAAGVPANDAVQKARSAGLNGNDALILLTFAKGLYCPTPK